MRYLHYGLGRFMWCVEVYDYYFVRFWKKLRKKVRIWKCVCEWRFMRSCFKVKQGWNHKENGGVSVKSENGDVRFMLLHHEENKVDGDLLFEDLTRWWFKNDRLLCFLCGGCSWKMWRGRLKSKVGRGSFIGWFVKFGGVARLCRWWRFEMWKVAEGGRKMDVMRWREK